MNAPTTQRMHRTIKSFSLAIAAIAIGALAACTTNSGFSKPKLSRISVGMTKPQVIAAMGEPDDVATQGNLEYLEYGYDRFMDGIQAPVAWYYVRLINGRVESYGKKGDFDTTALPQTRQQIEIIHRNAR